MALPPDEASPLGDYAPTWVSHEQRIPTSGTHIRLTVRRHLRALPPGTTGHAWPRWLFLLVPANSAPSDGYYMRPVPGQRAGTGDWVAVGDADNDDDVDDWIASTLDIGHIDMPLPLPSLPDSANGDAYLYMRTRARYQLPGSNYTSYYWSPTSAGLRLRVGAAGFATLSVPSDDDTIGQTPQLTWTTSEPQVAYQVQLRRPAETEPILYDSGWVFSASNAARAEVPQTISSGTCNARVRIRNTSGEISDWSEASDLVISYTLAVSPTISDFRGNPTIGYIGVYVENHNNAITWSLERRLNTGAAYVAMLDAAGINQFERERVDVLLRDEATAWRGFPLTDLQYFDYTTRSGLEYEYRVTLKYLNGLIWRSAWTTLPRHT